MAQDMLGSTSRIQLQLIWFLESCSSHPHAFTIFWIAFVLSSPVWLSVICNSGLSSFLTKGFLTNLDCCLSCSSGSSPSLFPVSHLSLRTVPVCSLMLWHVKWAQSCCEGWHAAPLQNLEMASRSQQPSVCNKTPSSVNIHRTSSEILMSWHSVLALMKFCSYMIPR